MASSPGALTSRLLQASPTDPKLLSRSLSGKSPVTRHKLLSLPHTRTWQGAPRRKPSSLRGTAVASARLNSTVELGQYSSDGSCTDTVVLTAKTKDAARSLPSSENGPLQDLQQSLASMASVGAPGTGRGASGSAREDAAPPPALWVATAVLAAWAGVYVWRRMGRSEATVDALAQRGFVPSDRSVRLDVIADFEDPTRVRGYAVGGAQLVELEPLSPLTEEKVRYHRELRRKEHGWKKPEKVLVEGEPIPEGVDPMTVRFIPKKHPFALSADDGEEAWSEEVARRRLRQRRGRPEKEQERSRQQLDRVRREMQERDAAMGGGDESYEDSDSDSKSGVLRTED